MRTTFVLGIALLIAGPALAGPSPDALAAAEANYPMLIAQARPRPPDPAVQRANVPRTAGTGLSGVPLAAAAAGATVLGMAPGVAAVVGILAVGAIVAIVASDDDDTCTPSGTGTGATTC